MIAGHKAYNYTCDERHTEPVFNPYWETVDESQSCSAMACSHQHAHQHNVNDMPVTPPITIKQLKNRIHRELGSSFHTIKLCSYIYQVVCIGISAPMHTQHVRVCVRMYWQKQHTVNSPLNTAMPRQDTMQHHPAGWYQQRIPPQLPGGWTYWHVQPSKRHIYAHNY